MVLKTAFTVDLWHLCIWGVELYTRLNLSEQHCPLKSNIALYIMYSIMKPILLPRRSCCKHFLCKYLSLCQNTINISRLGWGLLHLFKQWTSIVIVRTLSRGTYATALNWDPAFKAPKLCTPPCQHERWLCLTCIKINKKACITFTFCQIDVCSHNKVDLLNWIQM